MKTENCIKSLKTFMAPVCKTFGHTWLYFNKSDRKCKVCGMCQMKLFNEWLMYAND